MEIWMDKMNTPKLRFKEFTDEWQEKKLGDICNYKNGDSFENQVVENGKYNLITLNSIDIDGKIKNDHKAVNQADWFLVKNDLIMVLSDVAHGNFLGLTDIIPEDDKYVLNQRMGVLRKKDDKTNLKFLQIYINKNQKYFKLHGQGSSQQNLSKGDILKFKVVAPTTQEQRKIADFLGAVDEKIVKLGEKKRAFEKYKKGVMQAIFNQKIRFKKPNGSDYPDWEEKKLGDLLDYEQPTKFIVESTEYSNNFVTPVLTAGKSFILGYTNEQNNIFNNLPVIIFDDFTTTSQFVNFPFKVKSSAMKILKAKKGGNLRFVFEILQRIKYEIGGHGRHWISVFSNMKIKIPSKDEQEKIAEFLTGLDNKINLINNQLKQTKLFKKSLLQRMFV